MSENWQQSEICIVINDKSQDSTAKHLSYDGLLHYKFVSHCAGKRIFKIREHLAKLQAKWLIVSFALRLLSSKMQNSLDKLNNLFITDRTVTDCCYVNRQINVSLLSTKYQTAIDQFWLTDWQTHAISDWVTAGHVRHLFVYLFVRWSCSSSATVPP